MTEKELMEAMNHVEDWMIEEAAQPKHKKMVRVPTWAAAGICLIVGLGVAALGGYIYTQNGRMRALEEQVAQLAAPEAVAERDTAAASEYGTETASKNSNVVGVASAESIGSMYVAAGDYQTLYNKVKEITPSDDYVYGVTAAAAEEAEYEDGATMKENAVAAAEDTSSASASDADYSRTNIMTTGVDESDIVKTDGKYIYTVRSDGILVTDIRDGVPGEETVIVPPFEASSDSIWEIYVEDGRLIILTSHIPSAGLWNKLQNFSLDELFSNETTGETEETIVYVYDVTDPMKAALLGSMRQDGTYKTSRKIGDRLYLFTNQAIVVPKGNEQKALKEENLSAWVPSVNGSPLAADCIYISDTRYGQLISSFSIEDPAEVIDAKFIAGGSEVYVSTDSLYLYRVNYEHNREITEIARLSLREGVIAVEAVNSVNGYVRDRFAINEYDGHLRVLTTTYQSGEVNTLYVMDENMRETGRISEIARGEEVYAARFLGDLAYFVTYRNTDPLFAADLSDPANPKILGELSVTGFSEYLHRWDETHLLGIGYETDPGTGRRLGLKLTMFDVSDPTEMKVEDNLVLTGEDYSWPVEGEYKAILVDPTKGLIGFAMEDYDEDVRSYQVFDYHEKHFAKKVRRELDWNHILYRGLYSGDTFYIAGNGSVWAYDMENSFAEKSAE